MTAGGDLEEIRSGSIMAVKQIQVVKTKRGDSVVFNTGPDGTKTIRTSRAFVDETEYSLAPFKEGEALPVRKPTPIPSAPVEKVGDRFIVGLTKDELKELHGYFQGAADMLLKKIVAAVTAE